MSRINVHDFKLEKTPPTVFYIPNFINEIEETELINLINNVPKPKWTQLSHRRLQNWGGIPHPKGMIAEIIPGWLQQYIDRIAELNLMDGKKPNHVLINEYLPGQGIMAHLDGPLFYPTVTTISCGSYTILEFKKSIDEGGETVCNLLVEPRSLLILQDDMYHKYLHQIDEKHTDIITELCANLDKCTLSYSIGDILHRTTRISLTIRHVPKTSKMKLKFGH